MDTDPTRPAWSALRDETAQALLALPGDGLLDLLLPGQVLTASWLVDRALLELSGAPPSRAVCLHRAGWTPRRAGCWARTCAPVSGSTPRAERRRQAAHAAASALVVVLRDVLQVQVDDVELWRPGRPPDGPPEQPVPGGQEQLW